MIEFLQNYALLCARAAVTACVLPMLLPDGGIRRFVRFSLACVLTLVMLQPLLKKVQAPALPELASFAPDFAAAAEPLVHSVRGWENARVSVTAEDGRVRSITVEGDDSTIVDETVRLATRSYLVRVLALAMNVPEDAVHVKGGWKP